MKCILRTKLDIYVFNTLSLDPYLCWWTISP